MRIGVTVTLTQDGRVYDPHRNSLYILLSVRGS